MRLWKRKWSVQVDTIGLGDLDCEFRIKRDLRHTPNTCELTVYNLNPNHRAQLTQHKHSFVRVEAGYEAGTSLIFSGDVRKCEHAHDGVDWVTKIQAGDGERRFQTARIARSYGPDAAVGTVIRAIAEALGVGIGNAVEALQSAQLTRVGQAFPSGVWLHGNAARELQHLVRSVGMEYSTQDGVLQLLPRGGTRALELIVLSPSTGLLGVPTVSKKNVIKATCLLIPDLVPGRRIEFRDTSGATGIYRIEVVEYSGQTRGDDWFAELECKPTR
jgi:hypothetical protein